MEEPEGDQKRSVKEKGTEAVAKARARAEELLSQAEANRPRSRLIDIAFGSYERDAEVGGGILAGAVAFRVFLFIVPFVFFFVVAFGLAVDATGTSVTSAADKAGIAGLLATTIKNVGDQSVWSRLTILGISGFALVLGARNLVKVLTVIHVLIWRLPRVRVRRQARAVGLLILSVLGALVLAQLVSKLQDRSFPAWVFATSLFMLIPAGLWLVASLRLFPHPPEVGWRDLVPGALLVGVGIEALHIFTVVYIAHSFERKSETYGAIGGSLSLLLWAYVAGRILAASPVLNAVVWRRTHANQLPPPVVPNLPAARRVEPAVAGAGRARARAHGAAAPALAALPPPAAPPRRVTGLPRPPPPSATANGVLPPPAAPGNGALPPPVAAGNGRPPSLRGPGASQPAPPCRPRSRPPSPARPSPRSAMPAAAPRPRAARMSAPAGVPVIDVGPLRSADARSDAVARVARAMDAACRDTGFFCVTGHGVDPALLASLDGAARRFFALPAADKARAGHGPRREGLAGLVPPRRRADLRAARPEGGPLLRRGAAPRRPAGAGRAPPPRAEPLPGHRPRAGAGGARTGWRP